MVAAFLRPELDVLRFLAFLGVFLHHTLPQEASTWADWGVPSPLAEWLASSVVAGGLGVDLFFVLSGYLITELLLREREARGDLSIGRFYLRRTLRIWPLYFAFLAFVVGVLPRVSTLAGLEQPWRVWFFLLLGNFATAAWGYPPSVAAPLWSVSIEEQFYLFWPVLLRSVSTERLIRLLAVLALGANAARALLVLNGTVHPGIWCNTLARLDPILVGALVSV